MFLLQAVGVDPMWAYLIIAAVAVTLALVARRKYKKAWECGPGCICGGENTRTYQNAMAQQQQSPTTMIIQQPAPMAYPQAQPQIIVLQQPAPQYQPAPQPQVIYLPAQQPQVIPQSQAPQVVYLQPPAPTPTYQPTPQPQAQRPMSYYPGHSPEPTDYPQEVYYLPPSQPVGQLPPARASTIDEARRRFEIEREEMRQTVRRR